jgi:psp operon transcriptional activator
MTLAEHFAINMARELEMELFSGFSKRAKEILMDYHWPGNIRELKNVVERAVYRNSPHLPVHDIVVDPFESKFRPQTRTKAPSENRSNLHKEPVANTDRNVTDDTLQKSPPEPTGHSKDLNQVVLPLDLKQASQDFEIKVIKQALEESQFNQKKTAEKLSLTYHQLRGYLKKYNLLDNSDVA